jgi:hypothetical protein
VQIALHFLNVTIFTQGNALVLLLKLCVRSINALEELPVGEVWRDDRYFVMARFEIPP